MSCADALARCGASVVATDISEAALALTAENTNGTNGTVVTRLLDWDDDDALREVLAEGPFFAVVGAALKFEAWPADRLDAVLGVLDPTVVVLAHAWSDDILEGKNDAVDRDNVSINQIKFTFGTYLRSYVRSAGLKRQPGRVAGLTRREAECVHASLSISRLPLMPPERRNKKPRVCVAAKSRILKELRLTESEFY